MITNRKILFVIPARGGSKRLLGKNIKLFAGKPLITYTIECARALAKDEEICVSTDSKEIINVVKKLDLNVPFLRPLYLATDKATTNDVLLHALNHYERKGKTYDTIILLQPTSPFRKPHHIKDALSLYTNDIDMVVSVKKSKCASIICKEKPNGFLEMVINNDLVRNQDFSNYYEYNGAIYIINIASLKKYG
ncbi:cytidylyltransferase domain-containing protein, partial [Bacteroidota bacterium]